MMISSLSFDWTVIFIGFLVYGSIVGLGIGVASILTGTKYLFV